MPSIRISPSNMAAVVLRLQQQVQAVEGNADRFLIDVMNGMFVPNTSLGFPLIEAMRQATALLLEAHLVIVQPDRYLDDYAQT